VGLWLPCGTRANADSATARAGLRRSGVSNCSRRWRRSGA